MKKWDHIVDEEVSEALKSETLRKVEVYTELNKNYSTDQRRSFFQFALPGMAAAAGVAAYLGYGLVEKQTDVDPDQMMLAELDEETLSDINILLDLDILEDLDVLEEWEEA